MYGYIVPYKNTLKASDFVLYRSFYCGVCCQTGKMFGQLPRFTTNYDFAFLTALLFDYAAGDIVIEEHTCILNPFKKKAILMPSPLLERIAAANILLAYQKADDGVADGDGIKYRAVRRALKKPFNKSKKLLPDVWEAIKSSYKKLALLEKEGVASIDRAADPFADLLRTLPSLILERETDDNFKGLCYNIGKFVYLADALDDIDDDFKKKRFNPFLRAYPDFRSRKAFIEAHKADLEFIFTSVCARAQNCFNALKLTQSGRLLKNIVFDGMNKKTEELLSSVKKLKSPRI